ncbi:MAG: flagellar motor switch protein FliG [Bacillota bacterium]
MQKAAILLISLGPELSSVLMRQLAQDDIEKISSEIANTAAVRPETRTQVLEEFLQLSEVQGYLIKGGVRYARDLLEKTVGPARAQEILKRLTENSKIKPFAMIRKTDPKQLASFIFNEHPQTIALILSYLEPEQASVVLSSLPHDQQSEIARRIATMERTSPEILREVETVLEKNLSTLVTPDFTTAGGVKTLVDILNRVDRGTEKYILETLDRQDHKLAEDIRQRMFVFEDIITLDDAAIRRVLREVDNKDLGFALKGSSTEVAERVFRNLSRRAGEMLREDIEMMGPVRLRDVEEAQQKIVMVIRKLDEAGEIIISRGGEDAVIV